MNNTEQTKAGILIVEDELLIADTIRRHLEASGYECMGVAMSYQEATQLYAQRRPDLVLVDIKLAGEKTGIDLARWIQEQQDAVPYVFLTSQLDGKSLKAAQQTLPAGYLPKPVRRESLHTTIAMALYAHRAAPRKAASQLILNKGADKVVLAVADIAYISAEHVYVHIHTTDGRKTLYRNTLEQLVAKLPQGMFVRVHRSHVVQLRHVEAWGRDTLSVLGVRIPVSRSQRAQTMRVLKELFGEERAKEEE